jgi:hypothetical protein
MQHKKEVLPREEGVNCYCGGVVNWRTAFVHYAAKLVGLQIKIEGMPLGTSKNLERSIDVEPIKCGAAAKA